MVTATLRAFDCSDPTRHWRATGERLGLHDRCCTSSAPGTLHAVRSHEHVTIHPHALTCHVVRCAAGGHGAVLRDRVDVGDSRGRRARRQQLARAVLSLPLRRAVCGWVYTTHSHLWRRPPAGCRRLQQASRGPASTYSSQSGALRAVGVNSCLSDVTLFPIVYTHVCVRHTLQTVAASRTGVARACTRDRGGPSAQDLSGRSG